MHVKDLRKDDLGRLILIIIAEDNPELNGLIGELTEGDGIIPICYI